MKEIQCADHLKAAPQCVVIKTKSGRTCERNERGQWTETGSQGAVVFDDEVDFPATVIWSYAEQIGDPTTEALAQLAIAFINQQTAQQQAAEAAAKAEQERQEGMVHRVEAAFNGEAAASAEVSAPPA